MKRFFLNYQSSLWLLFSITFNSRCAPSGQKRNSRRRLVCDSWIFQLVSAVVLEDHGGRMQSQLVWWHRFNSYSSLLLLFFFLTIACVYVSSLHLTQSTACVMTGLIPPQSSPSSHQLHSRYSKGPPPPRHIFITKLFVCLYLHVVTPLHPRWVPV